MQKGERKARAVAATVIVLTGYKTGIFPIFFGRYSAEAMRMNPTEKRRRPSNKYGAVVKPKSKYVENKAEKMPAANINCGIKEKDRFRMQIKRNNNSVAAPMIAPIRRRERFCVTAFWTADSSPSRIPLVIPTKFSLSVS